MSFSGQAEDLFDEIDPDDTLVQMVTRPLTDRWIDTIVPDEEWDEVSPEELAAIVRQLT